MHAHTYYGIQSIVKDKRFAWLKTRPSTIQQPWNLTRGIRMASDFPAGAEFPIDPKWGDYLPDVVPNTLNLLIVSSRFRQICDQEQVTDVEYLPLVILDRKGRTKSTEYAVANLLGTVDCLDAANSDFEKDELEDDQIIGIKRLNVLANKIPDDQKLFRLAQKRNLFLIRSDLRQALLDAGAVGLETFDMNQPVFIIS